MESPSSDQKTTLNKREFPFQSLAAGANCTSTMNCLALRQATSNYLIRIFFVDLSCNESFWRGGGWIVTHVGGALLSRSPRWYGHSILRAYDFCKCWEYCCYEKRNKHFCNGIPKILAKRWIFNPNNFIHNFQTIGFTRRNLKGVSSKLWPATRNVAWFRIVPW